MRTNNTSGRLLLLDNSSQINKTAFRVSRHFHVLRKGQLLQSQHQNGGHPRPTRTPARSGLRGLRGAPSPQGLACTPVSFWGSEWLVLCSQQPLRFVAIVSWGQCPCTPFDTTLSRPGGLQLFCPLQWPRRLSVSHSTVSGAARRPWLSFTLTALKSNKHLSKRRLSLPYVFGVRPSLEACDKDLGRSEPLSLLF